MAGKSVLITGATGQQGGAVALELIRKGYQVRAMTRKPDSEKAQALKKLGAEIVTGDLNDAASLEGALRGVWGAFAVQNTWEAGVEGEEEQGLRFAGAAKKAGIQHYVYTSVGSAHRNTGIPHFENKWRVEQKIRALNFPSSVIIRPVFFMENWTSPWFKPAIDQGKLAIGMAPATRLQMVAVQDIGKYGALAIEEVKKFSMDFALMLEWFDHVGYNADIPGNAKKYGIKPTSFVEWASGQRW